MSVLVDIKKSFGSFALDVQFEVKNEVMALLGASGCGKSVTLQCVAGVIKPDSGVIAVGGRTLFDSKKGINLPPQKRGVGMLFQNYALFPNMTVRENLLAVLNRAKNGRGRLETLLGRFYLRGLENHYPRQLSGGQQQRAALARIMAGEPSVIMLDEPFSALDSYLRWQLELELAQTLDEFGGSAIFVSHNRDEVYRLSQKVCPMTGGRAGQVYGTKEFFETPSTLTACLLSGCKNFSRAEKRGGNLLYAVDWNAELSCHEKIYDGVTCIGVRARRVCLAKGDGDENVLRCRVLRVIEDMFSVIITALPLGAGQRGDFSRIRAELSPDEARGVCAGEIIDLAIKPENILLLSE